MTYDTSTRPALKPMENIEARLENLDWNQIERDIGQWGFAKTPVILTAQECHGLVSLYSDDARFRSRIDMARYRFGEGEYKYFANPLPKVVGELRRHSYPRLAAIVNRWFEESGKSDRYPLELDAFLDI